MVMMLPFTIGTTTESHATSDSVAWTDATALKTMYADDGRTISIPLSEVEAVKMVVPELVKRGYQIVSVSELAKAKGYTINNGNTYTNFK